MEWIYSASLCSCNHIVTACMRVKYSYWKLHTLIFHAITCITSSSASWCLRDFRSSCGSFGSPVLAPSVELIQAETELSSLKTDVMMTAGRSLIGYFDYYFDYYYFDYYILTASLVSFWQGWILELKDDYKTLTSKISVMWLCKPARHCIITQWSPESCLLNDSYTELGYTMKMKKWPRYMICAANFFHISARIML